jgi:phytoene dehydrogenase-like protein
MWRAHPSVSVCRLRIPSGGRSRIRPWRGSGYARLVARGGLSLLPIQGTQWTVEDGKFSREESQDPHEAELHKALQELKDDLTVAEFLRRRFAGPEYGRLRHSIERMVEGHDAADPEQASIFALREEWMDGGRNPQARIIGGYGALVEFLTAECRNHGVAVHLGSAVSAIEASKRGLIRCANGDAHEYDAVVLTVLFLS